VLSDLWDDTRYTNFRDKIHTYRSWIEDAYDEPDRDESIGKWQRVFGEDFAKNIVIEKAARVSDEARSLVERTALTSPGFLGDLVALFARYGRRALPTGFDRLPHKERPRWRAVPTRLFPIDIVATQYSSQKSYKIDTVAPTSTAPLPKDHWLKFETRTGTGTPLSGDYAVHWRVTNTDKEAGSANCLRGGFYECNDGPSRWERLQYRGVHTVEAFVVRKRDQVLVSQSEPFYVVIQ
jgi:hypothetical protein